MPVNKKIKFPEDITERKQTAYGIITRWFQNIGRQPFEFQKQAWHHYLEGFNGLLNAPTGSGKTYALWLPVVMEYIINTPAYKKKSITACR